MTRQQIKASIKRASKTARSRMRVLDSDTLKSLQDAYRQASREISADIEAAAASDGTVRIDVLQQLLRQVNARLDALSNVRGDRLESGIASAASIGTEPFAAAISHGDLVRIGTEAAQYVQHLVAADGLQLSDRVWRIDRHARDVVSNTIQQAVIQGKSASDAAEQFLQRGDRIPPELAAKIGKADALRISKDAGMALMSGEGNPLENAKRLFRTEINRAHGEAYQSAAFEHPDVIGTRFLLSPNHPRTDICDMHAKVNRYGLGPGIYPKDKSPWPAHPNTLSFTEAVFSDEVSEEDKKGKQDRISWLKDQPAAVQEAVLGSRMKRGALEQDLLHESQIATPWKVLKERYQGKGIDVARLKPKPVEPLPELLQGIGGKYIDQGKPVSDAMVARYHKDVAEHVLTRIDSLHSDGRLPVIPITNAPARARYFGAFHHRPGGDGVKISIRAGGSHKELTLAHEIGHFLDLDGTPGVGFASHGSDTFKPWIDAVEKSDAVSGLRKLMSGRSRLKLPGGSQHIVARDYVRYLLEPHEMWARSYAQWVAVRSGDAVMLRQIESIRSEDLMGEVAYTRQWGDNDFEKVADAIDEVMGRLGWM
jgi:hypothetical protein